jgi:hypothetical protein
LKKLIVIAALVLSACARHDDMLPVLEVMEPPVPANLTIVTDDYITFQIAWDIEDPTSMVSYYRLWAATPYTSAAPLDTTVLTSATIVTQDGLPIRGITFCVSSVTTENVESVLVCEPVD